MMNGTALCSPLPEITTLAQATSAMFAFCCATLYATVMRFRPAGLIDPFAVVQTSMCRRSQDFKILGPIVRRIVVAVMDMLSVVKRTAQNCLHDDAMLTTQFSCSALPQVNIPRFVDVAPALPAIVLRATGEGAKPTRIRLRWATAGHKEVFAAVQTGPGYGTLLGHHNLLSYGVMLRGVCSTAGALLSLQYSASGRDKQP